MFKQSSLHLHYIGASWAISLIWHLDCFLLSHSSIVPGQKMCLHNDLWHLTTKVCENHNVHQGGKMSRYPMGSAMVLSPSVTTTDGMYGNKIPWNERHCSREGKPGIWHNLKQGCYFLNGRSAPSSWQKLFIFCHLYRSKCLISLIWVQQKSSLKRSTVECIFSKTSYRQEPVGFSQVVRENDILLVWLTELYKLCQTASLLWLVIIDILFSFVWFSLVCVWVVLFKFLTHVLSPSLSKPSWWLEVIRHNKKSVRIQTIHSVSQLFIHDEGNLV